MHIGIYAFLMMLYISILLLQCVFAFQQVFTRLQKLALSISHKATISFVESLTKNHDGDVKGWKDDIEDRMTKVRCFIAAQI